jgi:hypothetical protein
MDTEEDTFAVHYFLKEGNCEVKVQKIPIQQHSSHVTFLCNFKCFKLGGSIMQINKYAFS